MFVNVLSVSKARAFFPCRANQVQIGDFENTKTMEVALEILPLC